MNGWALGRGKCASDGCEMNVSMRMFSNFCSVHDAVAIAKRLTSEEFAALKALLPTVVLMTDEERAAELVRSALSSVTHSAKALQDGIERAAKVGATVEQLADAQAKAVTK